MREQYIEVDCKELKHLYSGELILLVTATDLETEATHKLIKPLPPYDKIVMVYEGDLTLYFGLFGNFKVAHVQCAMGSMSRDSSIMTVSSAIKNLNSKIVIMVGIAFGVDDKKQNIGDVLISESVIPYNSKRVGKEDTIQRGIEAPSSKILLNRFKNIKTIWEYILPNEVKAQLITTRLLSGEELVDNLERRTELIIANPDSKGGEMEGAGVFAACDGKADWILVKGICDFADGEKGKDKSQKQLIAINSALSVCSEIFNSSSVFNELKVFPSNDKEYKDLKRDLNINEVLFDIYDPEKEAFYIERADDSIFCQTINQLGVWIYGPTGSGKSNLIIRNLIKEQRSFIQVSLASCIGLDIESFFKEILYEIASKVNGVESQIQPKNFSECIKALLGLLDQHYKNKELIIFVEEIPIDSEENYKEFSGKIFSLLISKNFTTGLDKIRFVLSSINNPVNYIKVFQQKVHQQLHFMNLQYWSVQDINALIELIEKELNFELPKEIKEELSTNSKGSPRFIKKFFRSVYTINRTDTKTLQFIIAETKRELSQFRNA